MIKNITKNTVLCSRKRFLKTTTAKAIGLMFSKKIVDTGLIFVFDKPIKTELHMFFVFFPIDVLFLDDSRKVIEIKENFKPFTVYFPKNKFSYVIELPYGVIKKSKTQIKDKISF